MKGLGWLLNIKPPVLEDLAASAPKHYRPFLIERVGKKPRCIDNPDRLLKGVQRRIYLVLLKPVKMREYLHGGVTGRSPMTNASVHLGARFVVRLDLKDFFPSITPRQVYLVWTRLGYCSSAAKVLTSLTTFRYHLPQGAPTSSSLANQVLQDPDSEISRAASLAGEQFTRYVDDLGLSGDRPQSLIQLAVRVLQAAGFRVSRDKFKLMAASDLQEITGLSLNSPCGPSVPRRKRDRIRAAIHHLRTVLAPVDLDRETSSITGRIRHVANTNPGSADTLSRQLQAALDDRQ